jgi:large subunit ribosomal protein L11
MVKVTIPALIEGGKATPSPPLGPALAPLGVPIPKIIAEINEKTKSFEGMHVPIKVIVDKDTKTFEVIVGTPPVSALIKKELGLKEPFKEEPGVKGKPKVGNLTIEQAVKLAKSKSSGMLSRNLKNALKEIVGTCKSMGVSVDGKDPVEVIKDVDAGVYNAEVKE